jgi:hypothetical protein
MIGMFPSVFSSTISEALTEFPGATEWLRESFFSAFPYQLSVLLVLTIPILILMVRSHTFFGSLHRHLILGRADGIKQTLVETVYYQTPT